MNKHQKLIASLYKGLSSYYNYASNLEDAIESCGDEVADYVYGEMSEEGVDNDFNHKDCRFLLAEVEDYLNEGEGKL